MHAPPSLGRRNALQAMAAGLIVEPLHAVAGYRQSYKGVAGAPIRRHVRPSLSGLAIGKPEIGCR
jgi:hypothetical protein